MVRDDPGPCLEGDCGAVVCKRCGNKRPGHKPNKICLVCGKAKGMTLPYKTGSKIDRCEPRAKKERDEGVYGVGVVVPTMVYVAVANTTANEFVAIVMRQLAMTPPPDAAWWARLRKWIEKDLRHLFPNIQQMRGIGWDSFLERFPDWNAHFPKGTRAANEAAVRTLETCHNRDFILRKVVSKVFLKREKVDKTLYGGIDPCLAPRVISSWPALINVITGVYTSMVQDYIHYIWGDSTGKLPGTVKSIGIPLGWNTRHLGHFMTRLIAHGRRGKIFENDFTLYDSSHSSESHGFYEWLLRIMGFDVSAPYFYAVQKAQGGPCKAITRNGWRYVDNCTLKSGSSNTCLLNSIVNVVATLFSISELNGNIRLRDLLPKITMTILGDDNVTALDHDLKIDGLSREIEKAGFISKIKTPSFAEDVTFLNMWFLEVAPGVFEAFPNIWRLFGKMGWAVEYQADFFAWYVGVLKGFLAMFKRISFVTDLLNKLIRIFAHRGNVYHPGVNKDRYTMSIQDLEALFGSSAQYQIWAPTDAYEDVKPTKMADESFLRRSRATAADMLRLSKVLDKVQGPCAVHDHFLSEMVCTHTG